MRKRTSGLLCALLLELALGLVAARPSEAAENRLAFGSGISYEHFVRTITWDDKAHQSKARADLITARGVVEFKPGLTIEVAAGLSLSNLNGLVFRNLPISLDYEAGAVTGLLLGAGVRAKLLSLSDFEIEGAGCFVYSLGFTKSWPLEGFAVEGNSQGGPTWFRASVGPRISYIFSSKFVPYVSVAADWFSGSFTMDQTLGDLTGHESKKLKAKSFMEISLGADYKVSEKLTFRGKAGFLPYPGGVDGGASVGFLYHF